MLVGETVEARSRALGVGAHVLEVKPVAYVNSVAGQPLLGDAVDAVAGRTPDGVLDRLANGVSIGAVVALFSRSVAGVGKRVGAVVEAVRATAGREDLRDRVLVIEHDAAEVAIDAVVEVKHVVLHIQAGVFHCTAGNDVAGNRESRGSVVAARLCDDADRGREVSVNGCRKHAGHVVEGLGNKSATNVESVRVEAEGNGLIEDATRVGDSLEEGTRVRCTRTDVEGNASNVEVELFGQSEELRGGVHVSTKLLAQTAETLGVVRKDAEVELSVRENSLDLVQLVAVVKGHLLDILLGGVAQVALGLARLRIDDAGRVNTRLQDHLNLRLAGAIKASSKGGQELNDHRVRVALDSKVRNDTSQVLLPAEVLAVDVSKVRDEEGILVASLAVISVDGLHVLLQGRSDHFFGKLRAMLSMLFTYFVGSRIVEVIGLCRPGRIVRAEIDSDRCHSLGTGNG